MRREGIVYSKQRRQHIATNRRVRSCRCMQRKRSDYMFEGNLTADSIAATFLHKAWLSKAIELPFNLETVGLYSVESVADMDTTHLAFVEQQSNHRDAAVRKAALSVVTKYKQMEDERKAMETLGLGARRHRDSLTKMERKRVEELATMPRLYCWSDTYVETAAENASYFEMELRGCETYGFCMRNMCQCNLCRATVRKRWRYSKDDDDDMTESSDDDDEWGSPRPPSKAHVSLFDFVDAAMTRARTQSVASRGDVIEVDTLEFEAKSSSFSIANGARDWVIVM
ncbi:Aste57867_13160 [Aphanomyces stellatus]|uniref:Aste57867_13160 protein n=1 Tax=Aphanomyces stellatus TaxID=120398 RepID=A0A485KYA2_9STRA|nr:hypothetical protein As57867_013111 [Aphanomyces stellatus]VFT90001.1 Aste57867_13160 [Aphanomyces stellatus]